MDAIQTVIETGQASTSFIREDLKLDMQELEGL